MRVTILLAVLLTNWSSFATAAEPSWQIKFDKLLQGLQENCLHRDICVKEKWETIKDNAALFLLGEEPHAAWTWAKSKLKSENPMSSDAEIATAILNYDYQEGRRIF